MKTNLSTFALIWVTLVFLALPSPTHSAKIVLMPFPWKSHVFEITAIGQALAERGHDVTALLSASYPDLKKVKSQFDVIEYRVAERDVYGMDAGDLDEMLDSLLQISPIEDFRTNIDGFSQFCTNALTDDVMFQELKEKRFDLVIVDAFPCVRCNFVFPYRLDIPYVSLTTTYEPWLFRTPAIPSFVPFPMAQFFTERMTFTERLSNLYQLADWSYSTQIPYISDETIKPFIKDKPFRSLDELARQSKLWLFDTDVVIDFPRPIMPNEINIGGLSTKPAKPLPQDLLKFADWKDGFIVVSFGSFDVLDTGKILNTFLQGFSKISQRVVLRSKADPKQHQVPSNVKLMEWIPQNDLLGHSNCRLFITHCGANGQFEALYHGIPMLGFPIFADQPYNARRVTSHGFGLHMDLLEFTSESLVDNINAIVYNESFYINIDRASAVFRSRNMTPRERAAYWVEQVLYPGVDHLRPNQALEMPWYEYLMLDILLVVVVMPLALFMAVFCGIVCYCCMRRKDDSEVKPKKE